MAEHHVKTFMESFEREAIDAAYESDLPSSVMAQLSTAISMKRIADALWGDEGNSGIIELLNGMEMNGRPNA